MVSRVDQVEPGIQGVMTEQKHALEFIPFPIAQKQSPSQTNTPTSLDSAPIPDIRQTIIGIVAQLSPGERVVVGM